LDFRGAKNQAAYKPRRQANRGDKPVTPQRTNSVFIDNKKKKSYWALPDFNAQYDF
jgi:hypothetical protein